MLVPLASPIVKKSWAAARGATAERVWAAVMRPVAVRLAADASIVAASVNQAARAAMVELVDEDVFAENLESTEATLRLVARALERGDDPAAVEVPAATVAFARTEVQRRVALVRVSQAYRVAHQEIWRWLAAEIRRQASTEKESAEALELASDWLFAFIGASITVVEGIFAAEQDVWTRSLAARRAEAITDILDGREVDARSAEARLRHPILRHHVGVIAWSDRPAAQGAQETLDETLAEVVGALEVTGHLPYPVGLRASAIWGTRAAALSRRELRDALKGIRAPDGVRLAVGGMASGLAGFRRTYREATHARRISMLLGAAAPSPTTFYDDVAVEALATVDMEQAGQFVERVLGGLSGGGEAMMRVAETVAVYLSEGCNRARTAERMVLHGNTVRYRLNQAEELLGRRLDTDTRDLQVALALLPVISGPGTPTR